jgi:hypothetical protein
MFHLKSERIFVRVGIGLYNKCGLENLILVLTGSYNVTPSFREAEIKRYKLSIFSKMYRHINMVHDTKRRSY